MQLPYDAWLEPLTSKRQTGRTPGEQNATQQAKPNVARLSGCESQQRRDQMRWRKSGDASCTNVVGA